MDPVSHALPILDEGSRCRSARAQPIRRSTMSRRRFTVLIVVQALMLLHIAQWLLMGVTLAPVEPSESMETVKHGVVTVGFILFSTAILSTAILGRWFCGWGCHVVLLQDWCARLLHRIGVRPRAFRSRILLWMPLALAVYMFVWPIIYRLVVAPFVQPDLVWPGFTARLVVTDFWTTFPGWITAIPFLLVCGFLAVYFLGQKGYCTYACPYAGVFVPIESLAVGRIRVNENCEGCGHCTAVCTSNVRVHEEIAQYGMVVDPGCMKCLDCVSVCPKEALSFGFGGPAAGVRRVESEHAHWDLSLRGEIALALTALAAFYAVYFPFGFSAAKSSLPLLFASGVAACAAFMAWKASQVLRRVPAGFHRWSLVRGGRIQRAGYAWIALTALLFAALADLLALNLVGYLAYRSDLRVQVTESAVFSPERQPLSPEIASDARNALALYEACAPIGSGGFSLIGDRGDAISLRRAWLHAVVGEFAQAEALLRGAWASDPREPIAITLGRVLRAKGDRAASDKWFSESTDAHRDWPALEREQRTWLMSEGRDAEAFEIARSRARRDGAGSAAEKRLSAFLIEQGNTQEVEEGLALASASLAQDGSSAYAQMAIGMAHLRLTRPTEAIPPLRRAAELAPTDPGIRDLLSQALEQSGDAAGARRERETAAELRQATPVGTHSHD